MIARLESSNAFENGAEISPWHAVCDADGFVCSTADDLSCDTIGSPQPVREKRLGYSAECQGVQCIAVAKVDESVHSPQLPPACQNLSDGTTIDPVTWVWYGF